MTAGRNVVSVSQTWCTPPKYVAAVKEVFGGQIALDPCSNEHSVVGAKKAYSLPAIDGLAASWDYPTIYVNPPYGADRSRGTTIKDWMRRCATSRQEYESEVIALVPVATNTKHWKDYVWGVADAVAFLYDTRLKFLVDGRDEGKGAPMSCCMIYWGSDVPRFTETLIAFGAVLDIRALHGKRPGVPRGAGRIQLFEDPPLHITTKRTR